MSTQFDVVVLGTGMVESIVAAAAARQGHSVLHLDNARYYGGQSQDCVNFFDNFVSQVTGPPSLSRV